MNVAGSFVLGVLLAEEPSHQRSRVALHDFGAIGFCGGLTTFSTFAVEVVDLIERGRPGTAVSYALVSLLSAVGAVLGGAALLRRARAVRMPVEGAP